MPKVTSWGNTSEKNVEIKNDFVKIDGILPIGNNNSYGDCALPLGNFVIKNRNFLEDENFINSNLTLEEYMYKNNKMLYAIPGKSNVTLAGAIASDVHGKDSYWGGTFIKNIESLLITLPSGENIQVSRDKNPELFYTTFGGFGLTGLIKGVKFKRNNLKLTNDFYLNTIKGAGLNKLFDSFPVQSGCYVVGWMDLISDDLKWVISSSLPNKNSEKINLELVKEPIDINLGMHFLGLDRRNSLKFINLMYFKSNNSEKIKIKKRKDVFYPINFLTNTKNISKGRKIIQIQFSVPIKNQKNIISLLEIIKENFTPLLCSVKRVGTNETDLNLSFIQNGWSFAIDFPFSDFNYSEIRKFYNLLIENEGKVYLAKDSTLNDKEFHSMYPNLQSWRKVVKNIDPENIINSQMSNRLGIKNW